MQKILALESLRGIAALIVVFSHFAYAFYPAVTRGLNSAVQHSTYEWVILYTPLNLFINGYFAVLCFFVLSGFVLSFGYFTKAVDLVGATMKRYFRLAPVVLASVILSFLIIKLNLYMNHELALTTQSEWLKQFWGGDPSTLGALWEGLVGGFAMVPTEGALNPVLWTIYYELAGSALVFAFLALAGHDNRRWFLYILILVAFSNTFYFGFIVGVLLCDLYTHKADIFNGLAKTKKGYKIMLLGVATYFASYPAYVVSRDELGIIHLPLTLFTDESLTKNVLYAIATVIIISLLLTSRRIVKFFEFKWLVWLGSVSYSLYATHLLLLGSAGAAVFLLLDRHLSYNLAALLTLIVFMPIALIVAALFRKYIDEPSISLSSYVVRGMSSRRQNEIRKKDVVEDIL